MNKMLLLLFFHSSKRFKNLTPEVELFRDEIDIHEYFPLQHLIQSFHY